MRSGRKKVWSLIPNFLAPEPLRILAPSHDHTFASQTQTQTHTKIHLELFSLAPSTTIDDFLTPNRNNGSRTQRTHRPDHRSQQRTRTLHKPVSPLGGSSLAEDGLNGLICFFECVENRGSSHQAQSQQDQGPSQQED